MYKFLTKNGQTVAFLLGLFFVLIFLISVMSGSADFDSLPKEEQYASSIFNPGLYGAIILTVAAIGLMVVLGLLQIGKNFKGSVKGLIGFGLLAATFFVTYSMAPGEADAYIQASIDKFKEAGNGEISPGNLKFIGGGITTVGILILIASAAFIISEVRNFFK